MLELNYCEQELIRGNIKVSIITVSTEEEFKMFSESVEKPDSLLMKALHLFTECPVSQENSMGDW